jgi:2-methylcitrate dehydratase PrpD
VIARDLARWVLALQYEDIDAGTESYARELILDHLGTAARGGVVENMPSVDATLAAMGADSGSQLTAVVGKRPARPEWAVFSNAIAAHSIELDDTRSDAIQKSPVVGNRDHTAFEVQEQLFQPGNGIQIQVVGGFVQ